MLDRPAATARPTRYTIDKIQSVLNINAKRREIVRFIGENRQMIEAHTCRHAAEPIALSVVEAARRASLSRAFLYEQIVTGALPSVKIGKRRLLRPEALRAWPAARESGGVSCG
jgi:excisionase family DNA binding protein